jgi:hypothetical protein
MRWAAASALGLGCLSGPPASARGLGLYQESAPWYVAVQPDTVLVFEAGATLVAGSDGATLFSVALSPIQRGPFQFAVTWGAAFSRFGESQSWGTADPKVYARARLPLPSRFPGRLFVEGVARLPVADAALFPYAFGGQELELMGVLALGSALTLGGGRQMTEPPSGSVLTWRDVPHANHFWASVSRHQGNLLVQARGDALLFEIKDRRRWIFAAHLVHGDPRGLTLRFTARSETGPDRLFDAAFEVAFATSLR